MTMPTWARAARKNSARPCDIVFWRRANVCAPCWCFWLPRLAAEQSRQPCPRHAQWKWSMPIRLSMTIFRPWTTTICGAAGPPATRHSRGHGHSGRRRPAGLGLRGLGRVHPSSGCGRRMLRRIGPGGRGLQSGGRSGRRHGRFALRPRPGTTGIDRPPQDRGPDSGLPPTRRLDGQGRRRAACDPGPVRSPCGSGLPDHRRPARRTQQRTIAGQRRR